MVWNGRGFFLDPFQQLFNKQRNTFFYAFDSQCIYDIIITQGKDYCYIRKLGGYNSQTGEIISAETIGDTLLNVSGKDLIGTGDWFISPCGTYERDTLARYQLEIIRDTPPGTEIVMTVKQTMIAPDETTTISVINYHTLVEIPNMELEAFASNVQHYYGKDFSLEAYAEPHCDCGGYLPSWVKFSVEILQGQEYGSIYDKYTGQSSNYLSNIESELGFSGINMINRFSFVADGAQPDSNNPGLVKILFTPSDLGLGTAEIDFSVEYNDMAPIISGLLADIDKPEIHPVILLN